ncbi:uncharacterized protein LOC114243193 [Bombyx mandarina]|uniref:Uncharacterized protein LOC114243193 n=1 Tax=Bombyx mandarina TaxID=7092 RepID=A0A6J2JQ23_BOMMA|nr:uncharacterized protein LOC114243193 [Bombyx mandarina]
MSLYYRPTPDRHTVADFKLAARRRTKKIQVILRKTGHCTIKTCRNLSTLGDKCNGPIRRISVFLTSAAKLSGVWMEENSALCPKFGGKAMSLVSQLVSSIRTDGAYKNFSIYKS